MFPCWDQGVNFGVLETQTFSPGPMMSTLYRGPSNLGGLLDGVLDNPSTPCAIDWAGQLSSAMPHHTDDVEGYSNSSLSQLLEAGPSQGTGMVLGGPPPAVSTSQTLTWTKRKAVDCKSDNYQGKKAGQLQIQILQSIAIPDRLDMRQQQGGSVTGSQPSLQRRPQ